MSPLYTTELGQAYNADSINVLAEMAEESVDLVVTSPPFALQKKKSYGNVSPEEYCEWFAPFAEAVHRVLKPSGSFVIDIGGSWKKGSPTRSLYNFELLLGLCLPRGSFHLAQEFYWYNPAKMPAPAQWVTIERIRVKDAVQPIWWLSKTERPKADNRRILKPYTKSMNQLLERGYNAGERPSGHVVSDGWGRKQEGAIPPNVIAAANTKSSDNYLRRCREYGLEVHPARFVEAIPEVFISFLTTEGDTVVDPFGGSNVVGAVAERLRRKWITAEVNLEYAVASAFRFDGVGEAAYRAYAETQETDPESDRT